MSQALIKQYTEGLVKDQDNRLAPDDFDSAVRAAANKFSRVKPKTAVIDIAGNGSKMMPLPGDWETDFSKIVNIEYPVGSFPPDILSSDLYMIYQKPDEEVLFTKDTFAVSQTLRLSISVPYTCDETTCDIHKTYFDIVSLWAAARCLDELASLYSGDSDSTIQADSVDHNNKASQYAARARNLRKQFFDDLGIDPKRNIAAGAVVDFNQTPSHGHGRIRRSP